MKKEEKEKIHKNFNDEINLFFNSKLFTKSYRQGTLFNEFYKANPFWSSRFDNSTPNFFIDDKEKTITFIEAFLTGDKEYDYIFDFSKGSPSKFTLILNIYDRSLGDVKDKTTLIHSNSIEVKKGEYPTYQNALKRVLKEADKKNIDDQDIEYLEEAIVVDGIGKGLTPKETTLFNHFGVIDNSLLSEKIYDIAKITLSLIHKKVNEIKMYGQKKKKAELRSGGKLGLISENNIKVELKWKLDTLYCNIELEDHLFELTTSMSIGTNIENYLSICEKVVFLISSISKDNKKTKEFRVREYFMAFCDEHTVLLDYLTNSGNHLTLEDVTEYLSGPEPSTLEFFEDLIVSFLQYEFISHQSNYKTIELETIRKIVNELNTSTLYEQNILINRRYIGKTMVWQNRNAKVKNYGQGVNVTDIYIQEYNNIYQFVFNNIVAIVECFDPLHKPMIQHKNLYFQLEEIININDPTVIELDFLGTDSNFGDIFIKDRYIVYKKENQTFYGYNGSLGLQKSLIPLFKGIVTSKSGENGFKKLPKNRFHIYVIPRQLLDVIPDYERQVVVSDNFIFSLAVDRSAFEIIGINKTLINNKEIKFYKSDLMQMLNYYDIPPNDLVDEQGHIYVPFPPMINLIKTFYELKTNTSSFYMFNFLYVFMSFSTRYTLFTDGYMMFFTSETIHSEEEFGGLDTGLAIDMRLLSGEEVSYDYIEESDKAIKLKDNTEVKMQLYSPKKSIYSPYIDFIPQRKLITNSENFMRAIGNINHSVELDGSFINDVYHTTQGLGIQYMFIKVNGLENGNSIVTFEQDAPDGLRIIKSYSPIKTEYKKRVVNEAFQKGFTIKFNYEYIKKYYESIVKIKIDELVLNNIVLILGKNDLQPMLLSCTFNNKIMPKMLVMPMRK